LQLKGRLDTQCVAAIKDLIQLMKEDPEVTNYLFNLPASNYAEARFTDWIKPYLQQ
jgi:hypothetical protein